MRQQNLRKVNIGLRYVQLAFRLMVGGVVASAVFYVLLFFLSWSNGDVARWGPLGLVIGSGCVVAVGVLLGLHGKVCCLDTPPEMTVARTRIRLAVILEACGLGSGVVNGGVIWANGVGRISLPIEVVYGVFLFSLTLLTAGRAFFYAFTAALARAMDMKPDRPRSLTAVMLIMPGTTLVFASLGLLFGDRFRSVTLGELLILGGMFVTVCVPAIVYSIDRWFCRLREAVTQFNTPAVTYAE